MIKAVVGSKGNINTNLTVGKEIVTPILQNKTIKPSDNIQSVVFDPGYDGLGIVEVLGVELQNKTVKPSKETQEITHDPEYNGLGKVEVLAVDASIDPNIKPENIIQGIEILGVNGSLEAERIPLLNLSTGRYLCYESDKETAEFVLKHLGHLGSTLATNVPNCYYMFSNSGIEEARIDREYDFDNIEDFTYMFRKCANLKSFTGKGKFKMKSCKSMSNIFNGSGVEVVDFGIFDLSEAEDGINMDHAFNSCSNLRELLNLDLSKVSKLSSTFMSGTVSLKRVTFKQGTQILPSYGSSCTLTMNASQVMTESAVYEMLNSLGDNTSGYDRKIQLYRDLVRSLSNETLALAESKGYTLYY